MPYFVYILASRRNGTLYVGVTNDVARRVFEHREDRGGSFARRYGVHRLVYVETHDRHRRRHPAGKRIKRWRRRWKLALIESENPDWRDLYEDIVP